MTLKPGNPRQTNGPRTLFTADTHFLHTKIITLCKRPWATVEAMTEGMIASWNAETDDDDIVYHLGDFGINNADPDRLEWIFSRLNGRKHLILGNHDDDGALLLSWESVSQIATIEAAGREFVLCHYPLRVWVGYGRGTIHLHGHTHGRLPSQGDSLDVGVDPNGFKPLLADDIVRRFRIPEKRKHMDTEWKI